MQKYYYISGNMGMTSSGLFSRDKTRWMLFTQDEKERFETSGIIPYSASRKGIFVKA